MTDQKTRHASGASRLSVKFERISVGEYTITHDKNGDYWIGHKSGEGMQVFKLNFENMIDEYYKSEF